MELTELLERLEGVRSSDTGWSALCPAHDDQRQSLSIAQSDGKLLIKCHAGAGCPAESIVAAMGLTMSDLFLGRGSTMNIVATYDYQDEDGILLFQVVRLDPKDFRCRRPDGSGGWVWKMTGIRRLLYRLPDLLARPDEPTYIVEGEKDADRLHALGLLATCSPHGAGKWRQTYRPSLEGRHVIIIPDNDQEGRDHAQDVARSIHGVAASTRVLTLPGLPEKGDVSTWLDSGHTVSEIELLVEQAPEWVPPEPQLSDQPAGGQIVFEGRATTDMANGRRFAVLNRDKARYVKGWGWMVYTGRHWERDELAAMVLARAVVQSIYAEAAQLSSEKARVARGRHAFSTESLRWRKAMLESARSEPEMKATLEDFDGDGWLFNCANGTLDLRTGALRPHAASDMLTKLSPISFDGDADLGHWRWHIEYFLPNPDVRRYVQRQLGRSLVGAHLSDDFPIWYGEGANGRSTMARALQHILGDYCQQAAPRLLLASNHERHPTELAELYGKRLVFSIEIDEGARLAEALVKQLSGGDRVRAHFMRQDNFEFAPTWTLVMVVNNKPVIRTGGHSTWRRIKLVPWTVIIPDAEQRAQEEVIAELVEDGPAVLRWLHEGLMDWQADPHWCPDEVRGATASYRAEQDPLKDWVAACCFLGAEAWASAKALRASYETWGSESGIGPKALVSGAKWGRGLRSRGCKPHVQRDAGKLTRGWLGIGLLSLELEGVTAVTDTPSNPKVSEPRDAYTGHGVTPVTPVTQGNLLNIGDDVEPVPV